jgi:hypothetical protein
MYLNLAQFLIGEDLPSGYDPRVILLRRKRRWSRAGCIKAGPLLSPG